MKDTVLITEGKTLLFVPKGSQESNAPPKTPAFFNPRARINRDMSLLAYGAVAEDYGGDLTYLDALCGLHAQSALISVHIAFYFMIVCGRRQGEGQCLVPSLLQEWP